MTRTLLHSFDPPTDSPVTGATIDLTISEIEDAGIREVLQTPGASYGTWSIFDSLLSPGSGGPFIFREPLGQAREVKVALSGLFGRFIARAYLERYFGLCIFAHLGSRIVHLDRGRLVKISRRSRGDLPDWIACASDFTSLTVAEAKGCHDVGGPARALNRAWAQAGRIDVTVKGKRVTVKRIAIATRWGMATGGPLDTHLSVRDPVDEGEVEDEEAVFIGLFRRHIANLIAPLGHGELAGALRHLAEQSTESGRRRIAERARTLLRESPKAQVDDVNSSVKLISGIVTRMGPIDFAIVDRGDEEVLSRLDLRPVLVGIDRDLVLAAIDADPQVVRGSLANAAASDEVIRRDRAGGWIIPLGRGRSFTRGT